MKKRTHANNDCILIPPVVGPAAGDDERAAQLVWIETRIGEKLCG
jgi:hypothetical protein